MMLANDLKTYYDEVRRYLDCPKDEQDRLLLSVNKQVIELQVDNPNLDYDGIVEFLGESFNRFLIISLDVLICRYSPLFRAFPALFISEEPHKSFYYPSCFRSQK